MPRPLPGKSPSVEEGLVKRADGPFHKVEMVRCDGEALLPNVPLLSRFPRGVPEPCGDLGTSPRQRSS